jgi:uncharacterized protein
LYGNQAEKQRIKYSFLKIITGSDLSRKRIPMMMIESENPGPVLWLTACGHGDEVGGIVVIQEVFKNIQRIKLIKGSIYAFPLMNPLGFETSSRQITISEEDLNRAFPGKSSGSLAERIAHKIFTTIVETNPSCVLDLHNDWIRSIPYALIDAGSGSYKNEIYEQAVRYAGQSGFLMISDTEVLNRSLSHSLLNYDIPALTLELGESYIVNETNIQYGFKSIWNVLSFLGMVENREGYFQYPLPQKFNKVIMRYTDKPLSSSSGVIRFLVKPGAIVQPGQAVAKIYNAFGKLQETIRAASEGIVLGHTDYSAAYPGVPVMYFGVMEG